VPQRGRPVALTPRGLGFAIGAGTGSGTIPGLFKNGSIGVQLNWPLFAGFAVQNRVKETVSLEEKSRNDLDAARRSVTQLTRQSYYDVQSSEASMRALEAAESSSKLALEATQLGYKVGVRVNLDVLNAQTQLFNTQRDLSRARYDVVINRLKLRQAAGAAHRHRHGKESGLRFRPCDPG
jgi:outer membrane protein